MNFKRIFMTLMVTATIAAFAADKQELNFTVLPKMSCQNCENKIKSNLRFEKGIKAIKTSIPDQKVTITFDPEKTNETKIIEAFSKIGYKASVIKDRPKDQSVSDKASPNKSN